MNNFKQLQDLRDYYLERDIPENLSDIVKKELNVDISAKYGSFRLKNCILVAPGQMTINLSQAQMIKESSFAGCVLKSVVAEDKKGSCSMIKFRRKPTYVETVYWQEDKECEFPIIHWDGGLDTRNLNDYLEFADSAVKIASKDFLLVFLYLLDIFLH